MTKLHFVTVTYFLEVKHFNLYISETVRASAKMCGRQLPWNSVTAKIALCDLDLLFGGKKIFFVISFKRLELAQKCVASMCRFRHWPENGVIEKIVLCDLDLLFGGETFKMLIPLKQ